MQIGRDVPHELLRGFRGAAGDEDAGRGGRRRVPAADGVDVNQLAVTTPLDSWFAGPAALHRARRGLRDRPVLFAPHDRAWRSLVPPFDDVVRLATSGLPFQIAAERRYNRSGRRAHLRPALASGKTVFIPQAHQVLPRVMRLVVALRRAFFSMPRDETSFLFLVDGRGREGLGLHHDGEVASFWLQLEGRRTVTLGPQVRRGTPQEIPDRRLRDQRFTTRALAPGSLLYLPPRTPHRVVCYERSLALSLTWSMKRGASDPWDVVSGRVAAAPPVSRTRVWTQVPLAPRWAGRFAKDLAMMASFPRRTLGARLPRLEQSGIVGPQDLPLVILPEKPSRLDGWRFA